MRVYTPSMVERLLRNYLDIICTLEARGQQLPDTYNIGPRNTYSRFKHAQAPVNGKEKARAMEELHVSALDLEQGLKKLAERDPDAVDLLVKYHVKQTHTLDDLLKERNKASRGSMQRLIYRCVERLARVMEEKKLYEYTTT